MKPGKPFWMALFCFCLITAAPPPADADDASLGRTPDGVYPLNEAAVTMVAEDIRIELGEDGLTSNVVCEFTFHNEGEEKSILMGFPASQTITEETDIAPGALELQDFQAEAGGKELKVTTEKSSLPPHITLPPGMEYDRWYTFTLPFAAGETKKVRNTYRVKNLFFSNGEVVTGYVLQTGRFWKGPIGRARVTFDLGEIKPYHLTRLYPNCFRFDGNTLVFERENFEPAYDLEVSFDSWHFSQDFLANAGPEYRANFEARLERFAQLEQKLTGADPGEISSLYQSAVSDGDPILAQYILSRLPAGAVADSPPQISAIEVLAEGDNFYRVSAQAGDANADFTSWQLTVTHREGEKEVVDLNDEDRFLDAGYTVEPADGLALEEGKEYRLEFILTDAADQVARKAVSYSPGDAAPQPVDPEPGEPTGLTFILLGGLAVVAAAVIYTNWQQGARKTG